MFHGRNKILAAIWPGAGAASSRPALGGSYLHIDAAARANLAGINTRGLAEMSRELGIHLIARSSRGKREMFFKGYRSTAIASQFSHGAGPAGVVRDWHDDIVRFKGERRQYLLY